MDTLNTARFNPVIAKGIQDAVTLRCAMVFHPPDRRARDVSNMFDMMKSAIDGVADGLGINDRKFKPWELIEGVPERGGTVVLVISLGEINHEG